jgi:Ca2+-binding EF-hand superfamily protein
MESLARSACAAPNLAMAEDSDAKKGTVTVLPAQDQLLLTDGSTRYHRFKPSTFEKGDLLYTDRFRDTCIRKYTTLCLAWRLLLDADGVGRVAFVPFCTKARFIGFREPKRLWRVLNTHRTNFLTLDEWDPVAFRNLYEFRGICLKQFGTMDTAFKFGMDKSGSSTCTMSELVRFCDDHDFSGDVKELFEALDMHQHGFITCDELEFLAKWEGESHLAQQFDFDFERLQIRKRKAQFQHAKMAALLPGATTSAPGCASVDPQLLHDLLNEAECDLTPLHKDA